MLTARVLPCLLLRGAGLVKTVRFKDPTYLGDPRNAVRIFNDREVNELVFLDITATPEGRAPQFDLVREVVSEAFMPVAYGGGIRSVEDARTMLALGVEKIVVSTHAVEAPTFVREAADLFGSQSVVVCMDVRRSLLGKYEVCTHGGRKRSGIEPVAFARRMAAEGAGEIVVNSIDRDGTMSGYDIPLIRSITTAVDVPVVACGGAGSVDDLGKVVWEGGASAAAAGSLFVFHGKHRAVLITYPDQAVLRSMFREEPLRRPGAQ